MKQRSAMCVGGPLDGEWWPLDGGIAPVSAVREPASFEWTPGKPQASSWIVHYRREHMTHQTSGTTAVFFVAEDVSFEDAIKIVDERFPAGAPQSA